MINRSLILMALGFALAACSSNHEKGDVPEEGRSFQCWKSGEETIQFHNLAHVWYPIDGGGIWNLEPKKPTDDGRIYYKQADGETCVSYNTPARLQSGSPAAGED